MWTFVTKSTCALIIAFLALESSTAQCATDEEVKCTTAVFLDPLGLEKCVQGKQWDLCHPENQTTSPAKQLAKCLHRTGATRKFLGLLLRGLRHSIKFFLDLVSPGSSQMIQGILDILSPPFVLYDIEARNVHAKEGCKKKVNITVPENLGIRKCADLVKAFCKVKEKQPHLVSLGHLVPSIVCFLQNVPAINVFELLKEISCILLRTVINALEGMTEATLFVNFLKFLQLLLSCEPVRMIPNTAERSLLNK